MKDCSCKHSVLPMLLKHKPHSVVGTEQECGSPRRQDYSNKDIEAAAE